jgi:hypothetical protein
MIRNNIIRPKINKLLTKWSLDIVLDFLSLSPFELIASSDIRSCTIKSVFLISLATAGRIGEVHALSAKKTCLRWNHNGSVSLTYNLAKNRLPEFAPTPIVIHPLKDSILCPLRSLKHYCIMTAKVRKKQDPLFLHYILGKKTSPQLLSSWIRNLVRDAYE